MVKISNKRTRNRNTFSREEKVGIESNREINQLQNTFVRNHYLHYFRRLFFSMLEFENLPKSVYLPYMLQGIMNGKVVQYKDKVLGDMIMPFTEGGKRNCFGQWTQRKIVSMDSYKPTVSIKESVAIYTDFSETGFETPISIINFYADRVSAIQRSIDVNLYQQKIPKIFGVNSDNIQAIQSVYANLEQNIPFFKVDSNTADKFLQASLKANEIDLTTPFIADKLYAIKHNIINDFLAEFGAEISNGDKKERMSETEVVGQNGLSELGRNSILKPMNYYFEVGNKMFGTSTHVKFASELPTQLNLGFDWFMKEGGEDSKFRDNVPIRHGTDTE